MKRTNGSRTIGGFTMVELMIAIMVISVLAAIAIPAAFKVRDQARRMKAQNEVNTIYRAIELYHQEYGKFPVPDNWQGRSATDRDAASPNILPVLLGQNATLNPKGIVFLEFATDEIDPNYNDPWDRAYQIRMDLNFNGFLAQWQYPANQDRPPRHVRALAMVGSFGQDGVRGTDSDIVSSHTVE